MRFPVLRNIPIMACGFVAGKADFQGSFPMEIVSSPSVIALLFGLCPGLHAAEPFMEGGWNVPVLKRAGGSPAFGRSCNFPLQWCNGKLHEILLVSIGRLDSLPTMRRTPWLAPWKDSVYKPSMSHCVPRVEDRRIFSDRTREKFPGFMRMQSKFPFHS